MNANFFSVFHVSVVVNFMLNFHHVLSADCSTDTTSVSDIDGLTTLTESIQSTYSPGDVRVYECGSDGYGHIYIKCQDDGSWGTVNRKCNDFDFNLISIGGIVTFVVLIVLEAVFIGFGTHKMKQRQKDEEIEMKRTRTFHHDHHLNVGHPHHDHGGSSRDIKRAAEATEAQRS